VLEDTRHYWRELREGRDLAVAPYPERAQPKIGKWNRPLNRATGSFLANPMWTGPGLRRRAEQVEALEGEVASLSDAAFDEWVTALRQRILRAGPVEPFATDAFALIREATRRIIGLRHHQVQLMGGLAMLDGCLAEMATGEGKTITALLPAITASLAGIPVHIYTVNDYLASRDAERLRPVYARFGLSVGLVVQDTEPAARLEAYQSDVVYSTNKDITFDYLRDRTALGTRRGAGRRRVAELFGASRGGLLLRGLHFAIVDEADSIFIDEARTPLILSSDRGPGDVQIYVDALALADRLEAGDHFRLDEAERAINLNDAGRQRIAQLAADLPGELWRSRRARDELATQALSARLLFHRDREYIVSDGTVQIVDESTGRVMPDRSWEMGLHQMIEAKEGLEITGARETLARITYQRFFRRYLRLAGMSGTAAEVAGELWADYGLRVTRIPTNLPGRRIDRGHRLCETRADKWRLVAETIAEVQAQEGRRPILVGTRSVGASEQLSAELEAHGIAHVVLNARQDGEEAAIIAAAGHCGAVTVATNMAGRGTDIELEEEARAAGGLHVILTEFHESQRIDRQLYGRAGRQGDPGSCEAITAADDDLYRTFAPAALKTFQATRPNYPVAGARANLLRSAAQARAETRHASIRRQTELMEEQLDKSMAFAPTV